MELRTYRGGDDGAVIAAWNRACPLDPIDEGTWVRRVLTDPNFDPYGLWLAVEDNRIAGMALGLRRRVPLFGNDLEPETGWITVFFVDPAFRGRRLSQPLLEAVETTLANWGCRRIEFSPYVPHYFVPGLDPVAYPAAQAVLTARGYRRLYTAAAMDKNLVGFEIPPDVRRLEEDRRQQGFVIEPLRLRDVFSVIHFTQTLFDADWARALRDALSHGLAYRRIWVARQGDDILGFAMYGGYDGVGERFGPFGVHPDLRGTGLGKLLLYRTLAGMRAEGLHNAWFLWTDEHEPAGYLYRRAGFTVTRRFDVLEKVLDGR